MRQLLHYTLFLSILTMLALSGCVSKKAIGDVSLQYGDPNQRRVVRNAYFQKKFSPVAISAMGLSAGIGGYAGYQSNLTGFYKDGTRMTSKPANAAIGAVAGFGITYLVNSAIKGKEEKAYLQSKSDAYKWLRKDKLGGYRIIDFSGSYSDFRIVPQKQESRFLFKNRQDFADFYNAFGMLSRYFDQNVYNSAQDLSWDDLSWLYHDNARNILSPRTVTSIEDAMLSKAYTIAQFGKTAQAVSRLKEKAREGAFAKARTIMEYRDFASYFPEWREDASRRAFNLIAREYDVENFINGFPEKSVDALKKAVNLSLSQDEQYRLGQFTSQHAQYLAGYSTKTLYFFLPAYSFGIVTLNDVPSNAMQVSVSNAATLFPLNGYTGSFYLHQSFLSVVDPFSSPQVLKIDVTNSGSKSTAVCLHLVKNDFSKRLLAQSWDDVALALVPEDWKVIRGIIHWAPIGLDILEFIGQTQEQKMKSAIVKGLAYLLKERYEMDGVGSVSVDILADYLLDFVDHVHIK